MSRDPAWEEMSASGRLGGMAVVFLSATASTNEDALALARAGAAAGTLVVAESQSRGRGRLGKEWLSPPGVGLYCSLILRPRLAPAELPRLTLAAGLAVSLAVEKICGLKPLLKWPNDLWLAEKKLGGILAEALFTGPEPVVVLGVGLNVNTDPATFPPILQDKATSLRQEGGRSLPRSRLLLAIREEILKMAARLEQEGFAGILEDWRRRDVLCGRQLDWLAQDGRVVRGMALGPDDDGLLRIRDDQGQIHEVLSGDLTLLQSRPG